MCTNGPTKKYYCMLHSALSTHTCQKSGPYTHARWCQVCLLVHSPSKYVIITRNQIVQLAASSVYQLRQQYATILTHQEGYSATLNGSCGTYFARLKMPTNRCRMQWNTSVWTTFLLNFGAGLKQEPHGPNVAAQRSMVQERPTKVIPHLL